VVLAFRTALASVFRNIDQATEKARRP